MYIFRRALHMQCFCMGFKKKRVGPKVSSSQSKKKKIEHALAARCRAIVGFQ